jgi:hypothetical protein
MGQNRNKKVNKSLSCDEQRCHITNVIHRMSSACQLDAVKPFLEKRYF